MAGPRPVWPRYWSDLEEDDDLRREALEDAELERRWAAREAERDVAEDESQWPLIESQWDEQEAGR